MDDTIGLPGDRPHDRWMRLALDEARAAAEEDEVPVGAVVVAAGRIVASAHNQREQLADPTAHAEMIALREAAAQLDNWRLIGVTLYCTLEPCPMCAAAIAEARIARLVYAAADPKGGGVEHGPRIFAHSRHAPEIISGIAEAEAAALLKAFFASRR